jgi:hypothetical protein
MFLSAQADITTGLVGWWSFDNAGGADRSANNLTGQLINGPIPTPGRVQGAMQFNGANNYMIVPYNASLNVSSGITISFWLKADYWTPSSQADIILDRRDTGSNKTIYGIHQQDGQLRMLLQAGFGSGINQTVGVAAPPLNQWIHIAATWSGSSLRMYTNGVLAATSSTNAPGSISTLYTRPMLLARSEVFPQAGAAGFKGTLDEVRVYNRALSDVDIQQLYSVNTPTDITTGLVAYYPLNGNGSDFSGNGYNGTVYSASPTSDRLGNTSGALRFDGNADLVGIPSASINNLTSGTIAAWIKLNDNTDETITAKQRDSVNSWALFTVGYIPHTTGGVPGKLYFHPRNNVPTGVASSASIIPTGVWRHVAVTFSSTSVRIYINGALDSSKSGDYSVGSNLTTTNTIGGWIAQPNPPHWFNGMIDDVRIYNRALTDAEILGLKNWQRVLNFVAASGDSTLTEGVSKYFSCTATYTDGSTADVSSAATWSVLSPQYGSYFSGNKLTAGDVDQDRTITVNAEYTEGGIAREATKTITIKPSLFANLEVVTRYENCTPFARIDLKANVVGQNGTPQFQWNFPGNHESSSSGSDAWVKYANTGTYLVSANVTDGDLTATAWFHVVVNSTPIAGAPIVAPAADPLAGQMRQADNPTQPVVFDSAWTSRKNNGLIIITHGLHSSATATWIANMASAISTTTRILPAQKPNIVLLDWEDKANPLKWDQVDNDAFKGFPVNPILWTESNVVLPVADFVGDLLKIRRNGVEQGVYLADWIASNIDAGNISASAPIHFIGHSAGGFVGGECGSILRDKITLVTMLDTPCPKKRHFKAYPNPGKVERYISSAFGLACDEFTSPGDTCAYSTVGLPWSLKCMLQTEIKTSNFYYRTNVQGAGMIIGAHSVAYEWYTNTIINSSITDGFYYSPFLGHGFHGASLQMNALVVGGGQMQFYDLVATQSLGGFSSFGDVVTNASGYQLARP